MGKYKFKVALIGDFGSGKSSLYRRIVEDKFEAEFESDDLECDFAEVNINVGEHESKVSLWDTAGMEEHSSMEGSYFRGLVGFLLVYDVCVWKSYERIDFWKDQIGAYAVDGVKMVLVGNKGDVPKKQRVVEEYEGKTLAATLRVPFFETSALTGANCQEALEALVRQVIESDIPGVCVDGGASRAAPTVTLSAAKPTKKKCC